MPSASSTPGMPTPIQLNQPPKASSPNPIE